MTYRETLLSSVSPLPIVAASLADVIEVARAGRVMLQRLGRDPALIRSLPDHTLVEVALVSKSIADAPPNRAVDVTASPAVMDLLGLRRGARSRIT